MRSLVLSLIAAVFLSASGCTGADAPADTSVEPEAPALPAAQASPSMATAPIPPTSAAPTDATETESDAARDQAPGDPARGRAWVIHFECARCHEGTATPATPTMKHCVHCHQDIHEGKLGAGSAEASKWREHTEHLRDVPSLTGVGARLKRSWIERFLQSPHDLRPTLTMTMPRLAITPAQARDIAAYLAPNEAKADDAKPGDAKADDAAATAALDGADMSRGRALIEAKGCGACHSFTGVPSIGGGAPPAGTREARSVIALAPDLRFVRDFIRPSALVAWLLDPKSVKADAVMPKLDLTRDEARDVAAYVMRAPLAPALAAPPAERLPVLSRRVTYAEVERAVFGVTCRHCHSEPKTAIGDGGPGNGGGFGYPARRLDLGSYRGVSAGFVGDDGERQSVFARLPDGTPRLVAALMARHEEEAGRVNPNVRGMPLGLPPLPLEEIQLVETWIAQGRPQ